VASYKKKKIKAVYLIPSLPRWTRYRLSQQEAYNVVIPPISEQNERSKYATLDCMYFFCIQTINSTSNNDKGTYIKSSISKTSNIMCTRKIL